MNLDYKKLGRYMLAANLAVSVLVIYVASGFMSGEASPRDERLFAPIEPVKTIEATQKGIFRDYSIITADKFLPDVKLQPGESVPLLPIPGASSALDRLVKLRGTAVSSEKELSCAILELLQGGGNRTVRVGDEIAGATVLDIGEQSILVSMEKEEITLFLDATEEYGKNPQKKVGKNRENQKVSNAKKDSGGQIGNQNGIPPEIQERLKQLPPEIRERWDNASIEEKRKYIKKFMEQRNQGGRDGDLRPARNRLRRN